MFVASCFHSLFWVFVDLAEWTSKFRPHVSTVKLREWLLSWRWGMFLLFSVSTNPRGTCKIQPVSCYTCHVSVQCSSICWSEWIRVPPFVPNNLNQSLEFRKTASRTFWQLWALIAIGDWSSLPMCHFKFSTISTIIAGCCCTSRSNCGEPQWRRLLFRFALQHHTISWAVVIICNQYAIICI